MSRNLDRYIPIIDDIYSFTSAETLDLWTEYQRKAKLLWESIYAHKDKWEQIDL